MRRSVDKANRAIARIGDMPYGLARTQAADQEVRQVDAEGPPEVLAYALSTLVDSMFWSGEAEKAFVPFTRLVRWWDEHPEYFDGADRHTVFWMFKWMVSDLMGFPAVSAAQIEATIADMERRYAIEGFGMNAVMQARFNWARERGADDCDVAFDAWVATPRDDFTQCEACEPGDRAAYLISTNRLEEGIRVVEQALSRSLSCASEPADMFSHLQLAYLAIGRDADAAAAHRRGLAHLETAEGSMSDARGRFIEFLARSGNDDAALRRVEIDQLLLTGCDNPKERLTFLTSVGTATHLIRPTDPTHPVHLSAVPAATVAELDDWAHAQCSELAAIFDARNDTSATSERVHTAWSAHRDGRVIDLAVLRFEPDADADADDPGTPLPAQTTATRQQAAAPGDRLGMLIEKADTAAAEGATERAATLYLEASHAAEEAGRTQDAGWAVAEAAHCARALRDHESAATGHTRAIALLEAAGTPPEALVPIMLEQAMCAAEVGRPLVGVPAIERAIVALDHMLAAEPSTQITSELDERTRTTRRRARAELTDVFARVHASAGDHARAATEAEAAAEALATLGATSDAAHAFWLAGRMHVALGDPDTAIWHLESALEGFTISTTTDLRAAVAGELIAALRAAGRGDEADAVTR